MTPAEARALLSQALTKSPSKPSKEQVTQAMKALSGYGLRPPVSTYAARIIPAVQAIEASMGISSETKAAVADAVASQEISGAALYEADLTEAADTAIEQKSWWGSVRSFFGV